MAKARLTPPSEFHKDDFYIGPVAGGGIVDPDYGSGLTAAST